jgi:CDP-diacylglycerol--glycerol-3-phosphate 3-phosphatidyltransferase
VTGRDSAARRLFEWDMSTLALAGIVILCALGADRSDWLVGAVSVWGYVIALVFRERPERLSLPTFVTLSRALLIAIAAGFMFWRGPVALAALAYALAVLLDDVDGRLARKLNQVTPFGAKLDMDIDAAGVLIATTLGILYGKLPAWYLAVGLARYLFVLGGVVRRRLGRASRELDRIPLRRWLAGLSMGFLATSLWPSVPPSVTMKVAVVVGGASLLMFARDFWFTSRAPVRSVA